MNNKSKEEKIKEVVEELEAHQSHTEKQDAIYQQVEKDKEVAKDENKEQETEQLDSEGSDEKDDCKKRSWKD